MKKHLVLLFTMLLLQAIAVTVSVFAQQKPMAGDLISGIVTDSISPLMAVYITELDSADRVVAYAYTDLKGEFSFSLVNPKDRIQFSYYRKERIILPIDKAFFEIRMEDDKNLPPVSWEEYEPLDSRDVKEKAGRNHLDISINTTDPGIPRTIHINREPEIQHEYVDLGLSVTWATCNVGADKSEDYGDFFAWGETEPISERNIENYKYSKKGDNHSFTKYCTDKKYGYRRFTDNKTTLDTEDDAAHVKWSGDWRMPTVEEFQELKDNCTCTWDSINGVKGIRFTSNVSGYTDRSIFLPAAGGDGILFMGDGSKSDYSYYFGNYWSSTLDIDKPECAKGICFFRGEVRTVLATGPVVSGTYRDARRSIRPVHP